MITKAVSYDYPPSGERSETVATLSDGRKALVCVQYGRVLPRGTHGVGCSQVTKMGGVCDCGLLDGIDVAALVADARLHGKRGRRPVERMQPTVASTYEEWRSPRGLTLNEEMDRAASDY